VQTIPTAQGLAAFSELLRGGDVQAAVTPMDWLAFATAYPATAADPFLQLMVANASDNETPATVKFSSESIERRAIAVSTYVRAEAARVLGMVPDRLDGAMPLSSYGLDSLMAFQLKSRIEADLGAVLPIIQFLHGPSVEALSLAVLDAVQRGEQPMAAAEEEEEEVWEGGTL
jgi:acyl carrier protein